MSFEGGLVLWTIFENRPSARSVLKERGFTRPEGRFIRRIGTPLTMADESPRPSRVSPRRSDSALTRRGRPPRQGGTRLRVSHGPLSRAEGVLRRSGAPLCARDHPARVSHVSLRLAGFLLRPSGASLGRMNRLLRPSGDPLPRADRLLCVSRGPLACERPPATVQPRTIGGNRHGPAARPLPARPRSQNLSPRLHCAASRRSIL